MKTMGYVMEHFQVPHPAPEPVEKASATFEEMTTAYQAARAKYHRLVTSRLDDIRAANTAAAAARLKGERFTGRTEAKIDADIAKAEQEMNVLSEATDQAGDALLAAVAEHRDEWAEVYEKAEAEAEQRLAGLIDLSEQASDDVHTARSAARWLREFYVGTSQTQYPGSGGHSVADFAKLRKIANGETRLIGYRDGGPIWETVKS